MPASAPGGARIARRGDRGPSRPWTLLAALLCVFLLAACSNLFSRTADQEVEAGMAAYAEGRLREARIAFMNALQADPNNRPARLMHARMFLEAGDATAAEAEITRARQAGAAPAETRLLLAHVRVLQGEAQEALDLVHVFPVAEAAYAWRIAGLARLRLGDHFAAMQAFDRAIAANANYAPVWLDVARYRRSIGDTQPALIAADRAVAADPNSGDALVLRGELTRDQYGLAAAIHWFDRALEIDPSNLTALLERAATYGDMGRARDMLADTRTAIGIDPDHPLPYFHQAALAARARNFDLARALIEKTRGAYDRMPAGMLLAAAIAFGNDDHEGAARRLSALVERQPGNVPARRLLAAARWRLGDARGAGEALRPIVDQPDADSYTLTLFANALEQEGDIERARAFRARAERPQQAAQTALFWTEGSDPAVRAVGERLLRGDQAGALAEAQRLQASMTGSPAYRLLVGDVLASSGDPRGAAEAYQAAANLAFDEAAAMRLIWALRASGQGEAADRVLDLFAAQNPRNVPAQMLVAGRALAAGHWAEAAMRYEWLRDRLGNGDAALLNNLAWAHGGAGDDDLSLVYARRAWLLAPANPMTADTLGWALYRRGNAAEGLALLLAAARGRPEEAMLRPARVARR